MWTTFGWVCFGMAVWGLCIVMQALQRRFAPELDSFLGIGSESAVAAPPRAPRSGVAADRRDQEIAQLKQRIEALEAIVTDRRYQWEQELRRG